MRGEHLIAGMVIAGSICGAAHHANAATLSLPVEHTTLFLEGDIPVPFLMTFGLDADMQVGTSPSYYILNVELSNAADATSIQFAKIAGAEVENGLYGPEGPPRLLFSDTVRWLHIHPESLSFDALLLSATLTATLPDGLTFTTNVPPSAAAAIALAETPLPPAAWLFGSAVAGVWGIHAWRRRRPRGV